MPEVIIYNNACNLHEYALNRNPRLFQRTQFVIDRFHRDNHTSMQCDAHDICCVIACMHTILLALILFYLSDNDIHYVYMYMCMKSIIFYNVLPFQKFCKLY